MQAQALPEKSSTWIADLTSWDFENQSTSGQLAVLMR
jgi:hypothetical protein